MIETVKYRKDRRDICKRMKSDIHIKSWKSILNQSSPLARISGHRMSL